jgi:hypothetical protein
VIEADIAISDKDDSIFLSVSKFQSIRIAYDGDRGLTYTIPLQLEGFLKSKVVGIKIRNKEAIRARVVIEMFSDLYLDDDWNLALKTELKSITWIEEPRINVAGIRFNLKPPIEKMLEKNKKIIVDKLDETAGNIVRIRPSIEKLWGDIQKPISINRKVVPVWLKADASDMDGKLYAHSEDTLIIVATIRARLHTVLDSVAAVRKPPALPPLKRLETGEPGLTAYALATVPFSVINSLISQVTDTMEFRYGKHVVGIRSSEVYGTPGGLAVRISLNGDLKADLYLRGTIGFDSLERRVIIDNFGFDINSENSLVLAADWFAHDKIIERLRPYMSLPLDNTFAVIPELITRAIEKGKLGRKIEIYFKDFDLNIHQHLITTDNIQIIVSAKGLAGVEIQKGIFDKKKKPV